jgi:hypothetical protein
MPDYQLGKIYKIVCNVTGQVYYGSTCEPTLARRLAKHAGNFKRWSEGKKESHLTSFCILENNNYQIVLVEKCPCNDKMELQQRERFYIENNECVNKVIPNRTEEEKNIYQKQYYENNKDNLIDCMKKYQQDNKEKIVKQQKQYYKDNKNEILKKMSVKFKCECDSFVRISDKARHEKSQKHQNYIKEQDI